MTERRRIIYSGRVQGVGFRFTAHRLAQPFPVTGFVKNLHDGTVHLEAQGKPSDLDAFLDRLALDMKPNITRAHTTDCPLADSETAFDIRY